MVFTVYPAMIYELLHTSIYRLFHA
uniref:Uncharacterized protein n=1 Tax=Arundo donax TaxID=35708 RepID=A0A0A9AFX8_ARUDO